MSFKQLYVHVVWATKYRHPFFKTPELRELVWNHIRQNAINKGIFINAIGGYTDHCHCLISLEATQRVSDVVKMIKGESSRWINQTGLCNSEFGWQNQYGAFSISSSHTHRVKRYITQQEEHHGNNELINEYEQYLEFPDEICDDFP